MDLPRPQVLAKLLLIQSVVGQFEEERDMLSFACRGLEELPGVDSVHHVPPGQPVDDHPAALGQERFPLAMGGHGYGCLVVRVSNRAAFGVHAAFVTNVCFTICLVLEERRQRRLNEEQSRLLELRVAERTERLTQEVRERIAAEAKAREQQKRAELYLEVTGAMVVELDRAGCVEVINEQGCGALGYAAEELIGANWFDVAVPPDQREKLRALHRRLISGEWMPPKHLESEVLTRAGDRLLIDWHSGVRRAEDGAILGAISSGIDVTEHRRLLENTQRAERMESLAVLAGGIAHDFNNMLGGLFGFVDLARAASESGSQVHAYLEESLSVLDRARALTKQLLTFSKGGDPVRRVGPLHRVVQESFNFALSGSRVRCNYDLPADLWPCDFDPGQIGRVFDNLAINAMEAMGARGQLNVSAANVEIRETSILPLAAGRFVKVSVRDYGSGISDEHLPRIFDPFYTTKATGSGLGLATCYSIVQRHGGTIAVDVYPDGTAFNVWLPAVREASRGVPPQPPSGQHRGGGTVLVMDDEPYMRAMLGKMLTTMGYEAVFASDGEEAISLCRGLHDRGLGLSGIILDLTIRGGMGGADTARALKLVFPNTPIVATSGYSSKRELEQPSSFGFAASLPKPFTLQELSRVLERHVRPAQTGGK